MTKRANRSDKRAVLEPRTDEWRAVGLEEEVAKSKMRFYRGEVLLLILAIAAVLFLFDHRRDLLPGSEVTARIITLTALVILGWALTQALAKGVAPSLMRRMDPGTAGTVGFLLRLLTIALVLLVALRVAGLKPETLLAGGAFTAVILGLAAQQTLANLFAGLVLQGTRPFKVGERVKLIAGGLAGQIDGVVSSLGLFYTTFLSGADRIMVPNSLVLSSAVVPLREPDQLELKTRLPHTVSPVRLQKVLEDAVDVPLRYPIHIELEELVEDEVVVVIHATPLNPKEGAKLSEEVLRELARSGAQSTKSE